MYFSSACILCRVDKLQGSTTVQLCNCTTSKLQDSTQPTGRRRELLLNEDLPPTYSWLLTPQNHTELHLEITRNYSWKAHRITPRNHSQLHLEITHNYAWKSLTITPGNHSQLHLEITQNHTWKSFKSTSENYFRITLVYYSESHLDTGHYFELQPDITHNLMSLERLEKGGISGVFQKDIEIWRDANANSPWTTLR